MQLRAGRALHIGSAREPARELSPDGQERSRGAPGLLVALPPRESRLQPKGPRRGVAAEGSSILQDA